MTNQDKSHDDWRDETRPRLLKSKLFTTLKAKCDSPDEPSGQQVMALVDEVAHYAVQRTKMVLLHMREFTLHDGDHLFRVLNLMERLIPPESLMQLSVPELMLLILSAFLHDIGMSPSEPEVESWGKVWDTGHPHGDGSDDSFLQFVKSRPDRKEEIARLFLAGRQSEAALIQDYLLADYIRLTHGERCQNILADDWNGKIRYRDYDLTTELASLCRSHTDDAIDLLKMEASLVCGPDTFVCLPFVGVVLRLADLLDFDAKRTPSVLFAHLGIRHPVSLKEWQKHRQVVSWNISPNAAVFTARCEHPAIEAAIRKFCDMIDKELSACSNVLHHMTDTIRSPLPSHYRLPLPPQVVRDKIGPSKDVRGKPIYYYRDSRFNLSQSQIIELLMGTSLYGDAQVTVRELIQNSIDACRVRQAMENTWGNSYTPELLVTFLERNGECVLRVSDNGIGMDQHIIDAFYSHVGSSFYKSSEFYTLQAKHKMAFQPISRFGIGILSLFMVSDSVEVDTRRLYGPHSSSDPLEIRIEGLESVFWVTDGRREQPGTATTLTLRPDHPWSKLNDKERIEAVVRAVPHPPFVIRITSGTETSEHEGLAFCATPLTSGWCSSSHVNVIGFDISDSELGLAGTVSVAILEDDGDPTSEKELFSKEVTVEGFPSVHVTTALRLMKNAIVRRSDSLEVDEEGIHATSHGLTEEAESNSEIAVHGISVPFQVTPKWWQNPHIKTVLWFPFALRLRVDVIDQRDLDLNTARSEIIYNEKWLDFAEALSFVICRGVRQRVDTVYWEKLRTIWEGNAGNAEYLLRALGKVGTGAGTQTLVGAATLPTE